MRRTQTYWQTKLDDALKKQQWLLGFLETGSRPHPKRIQSRVFDDLAIKRWHINRIKVIVTHKKAQKLQKRIAYYQERIRHLQGITRYDQMLRGSL